MAHRAPETVELLKQATPYFIPPSLPNSQDLNLVDYVAWGILQQHVYKHHQIMDVEELQQHVDTLDQQVIDMSE